MSVASEDGTLWQRLGRCLRGTGDRAGAISALRTSFELGGAKTFDLGGMVGSNRDRVALELSQLFAEQGQRDSTLAWARRLIEEHGPRAWLVTDSTFDRYKRDSVFRSVAGLLPDHPLGRVDGWRFDLDYLVKEAQRLHPSRSRQAFGGPFIRAATELRRRIPALADSVIPREFAHLVRLLGDGHSWMLKPGRFSTNDSLKVPLRFQVFSDGLFIVQAPDSMQRAVNARVVAIEGIPVDSFYRRLSNFQAIDNSSSGPHMLLTYRMPVVNLMHAFGLAQRADRLRLSVQTVDGRAESLVVAAVRPESIRMAAIARRGESELPLYRQRPDEPFWFTQIGGARAVYVQYNRTRDLTTLVPALRAKVDTVNATTVILDLRSNFGGFGVFNRPLEQFAAGFVGASRQNRLVVITSGATYSATVNLATFLERLGPQVLFAGTPTGLAPNFVGEFNPIQLPFSGVVVSVSSAYHQGTIAGYDSRPWIYPHIPAPISSQDFLANRDPAMDAILRAITSSRP